MMPARRALCAALVVGLLPGNAYADSVKKADLSGGYEEGSVISRPVLDTSRTGPVEILGFREAYDKKANVFRRKKSVWSGGGANQTIDKKSDLGGLFASALRAEASKMGFATGSGGWKIGGEIREIYLDNATPSSWSMGVLLFYTSMTVKFELESPAGERVEMTQRLLGYFLGGGRKVLENVLARQMVFAAQDALARLNTTTLKAPPAAGVAAMLQELQGKTVGNSKDLIRMVGLSGSPDAVGPLLEKLRQEKDAGDRTYVVEALAAIGSPGTLETLAGRYAGEDPDNRLATLKVYEYLGSATARRLAQEAAEKEPDDYLKQLAREVSTGASMRGPLAKK